MSGTSGTPSEHCGMSPTDTRDMAEPISASPFFCDSRSLSDLGKFVWYISVWGLEGDISISRDFPFIWKLCHPAISYWSAARLENTRFSNQGSMATFSIWFITIELNISRGTICRPRETSVLKFTIMWHHLNWLEILPPDGASWQCSHHMMPHPLFANVGHQHLLQFWPTGANTSITNKFGMGEGGWGQNQIR